MMDYLSYILNTGIGATAFMDVWGIARKPLLGISPPDYGLVGRWFGHMAYGRFRHTSIAEATPIRGERLIGWANHYLSGFAFAGVLVGIEGTAWIEHPRIIPAMAIGLSTVVMPFLLMQPGMGAGIAASRAPRPNAARLQSLITHAVFGIGLYIASWGAYLIYPA